jgi:hypothetical protein
MYLQVAMVCVLLVLTFWRKDIILYLALSPVLVSTGLSWYDAYQTPSGLIMSLSLMLIGAYSFSLAIINMLKGKE